MIQEVTLAGSLVVATKSFALRMLSISETN
jgi:hypothetical protein